MVDEEDFKMVDEEDVVENKPINSKRTPTRTLKIKMPQLFPAKALFLLVAGEGLEPPTRGL